MSRPANANAKVDLLRAAEAVFAAHGVDHAKIEDITERAGLSKGSFYLHFGSKEDAFRQIVETMLAGLSRCLDESVSMPERFDVARDAAEYFERWRVNDVEMFEFIWANRRVVRLLLEGGGSQAFAPLIDQFAERCREHTQRVIAWGVRHGLYRPDLDAATVSLFIAGGYDRVARQLVKNERKPDLTKVFADVQRLVLAGLASPATLNVLDRQVKNERRRHPTPIARIQPAQNRSQPRRKRSPVP